MGRVKTEIVYVQGDATAPVGLGEKIIVHVCNNIGAWGSGFVMALSSKWKEPETAYRAHGHYNLGDYELVRVEDDIEVCNMIGQENTRNTPAVLPPVRYVAIEAALKRLAAEINSNLKHITVHMPKIGSDRAGGDWRIIERIIEVTLCDAGIPVTVYNF